MNYGLLNGLFIKALSVILLCGVLFKTDNVSTATQAIETETKKCEYVIVLDPGHDTLHVGARGNDLTEEEINLKIAHYCKDYLENYSNVKVYLTHNYIGCPFADVEEASECNRLRTCFARNREADLFVSIHINNVASSSVNGYELYYPNKNYNPKLNSEGAKLAKSIGKQLSALGLKKNKVMTCDSTDNEMTDENFYPDGTRADYYNVIRNAKYYGILGIIVEHGYLSNRYDAENFLDSDEKLEKLGKADAEGIAEYLGLVRKDEK